MLENCQLGFLPFGVIVIRLFTMHLWNKEVYVRCVESAQEMMRSEWSPVIIDNTNTQAWQMLPYVRLVGQIYHCDYSICIVAVVK